MLKTMIIILKMHSILNILITNLTFVTNVLANRVLKLGITYQIIKVVKISIHSRQLIISDYNKIF